MATVADVRVKVGVDLQNFNRGMANVTKGLDKVGKQMRATGKSLSLGLTAPILALGAKSIQLFDKQAKALAQVETAVRSTGGAAQLSVKQLTDQASALQRNTIFGDEEILQKVTANLLTFTSIAGDEFTRTQAVVLDLATRMGTDLTSATIQLGKALNDPVANLGALSRSGIQFSDEQKRVIKSLVDTGRTAEAQRVILSELEVQFGGAAAAAAKAGAGPLQQLKNRLGDLGESIGELILPTVLQLADKISGLVAFLQKLSPETKKTAIAFVGAAAAIGPVLFILGGVAASFSAIFSAMTLVAGLINPWTLAFAALAAIGIAIYRNWDAVKQAFVGTWQAIKDLVTNLKENFIGTWTGIFKAAELALKGDFAGAWATLKQTTVDGAAAVVGDLGTFATDVGAAVLPAANALMFDPFALGDGFKTFKDSAKLNLETAPDSVSASASAAQLALEKIKTEVGNLEKLAPSFATLESALAGSEVGAGDVEDALNKISTEVKNVEALAPDFATLTKALGSETLADKSLVVMSGNVVAGLKGISDEVTKLETFAPDFTPLNTSLRESAGLVGGVFDEIPTTLTMPEEWPDLIKDVIPDKDESHRWSQFVSKMGTLKDDLNNAAHFAFKFQGNLGDIEESWRALFGTDSPQWMKDLVKYATDAGLIVTGLEAMVTLLSPSTWKDALQVVKDLGGGLLDILTTLGKIIIKIGEWILAQMSLGGGGGTPVGPITIGGIGTGVPPMTIPGTATTATSTAAAGGTGFLSGVANALGPAAVAYVFGRSISQLFGSSPDPWEGTGLTREQWLAAFQAQYGAGALQAFVGGGSGITSLLGGTGGTPSWLSGLQGYMGSAGAPAMGMGMTTGGQTINVNLDGQTIASATMPYWSQELEIYGTNR